MHRTTIALLFALSACTTGAATSASAPGARGTVYSPAENGSATSWSEQEAQQPVALRNLRRTPEASFHLLRLREAQQARLHAKSDLVLMTVAGALAAEVGGHTLALAPGDVVEIPRGTTYSLRSNGALPAIAYLVHTPALDPSDVIVKAEDEAKRKSAWQFNLWVQ